jgi:hypothetical protein
MPRLQGRSKYLTEESNTRRPFTNHQARGTLEASVSSFKHICVHLQGAIFFLSLISYFLQLPSLQMCSTRASPQRNLFYATNIEETTKTITSKTTKSHRDARSNHKQLTLASSHIYIQKEKATPNSPKVAYQ